MKKVLILAICASLLMLIVNTTTSCKTKEGCGLEEKYSAPVDRNGDLSKKRGKSNLFSKKQRKQMKKRSGGK